MSHSVLALCTVWGDQAGGDDLVAEGVQRCNPGNLGDAGIGWQQTASADEFPFDVGCHDLGRLKTLAKLLGFDHTHRRHVICPVAF